MELISVIIMEESVVLLFYLCDVFLYFTTSQKIVFLLYFCLTVKGTNSNDEDRLIQAY